mmetsp:Transcript_121108/g.222737  ORF Transcript_121108/g.222737 Transcript_121108/m.222737 type:complete len:212 (+) Transcript_121108:196-831(+)
MVRSRTMSGSELSSCRPVLHLPVQQRRRRPRNQQRPPPRQKSMLQSLLLLRRWHMGLRQAVPVEMRRKLPGLQDVSCSSRALHVRASRRLPPRSPLPRIPMSLRSSRARQPPGLPRPSRCRDGARSASRGARRVASARAQCPHSPRRRQRRAPPSPALNWSGELQVVRVLSNLLVAAPGANPPGRHRNRCSSSSTSRLCKDVGSIRTSAMG